MVGPTLYLMRADSATVASVWSRNTTTKISASEAASGASWASEPVDATPAPDDPGDRPRADQQRGQRDQALRRQRHAEHRDDDRDRGGPQPAGGDRVLDQHPRRERAERDQRLRPQAVVERQPRRQEHRSRGPHRDPVGRQPPAQPRQHAAADDQPGADGRRGGGQPHPHAGGADRPPCARAPTGTSRTAPRWRRRSGSSWRCSPHRRTPARWSGCSRRRTRWRR